ncbi:protein CHUP1, chloroplastic [Tanacetum coccineum]
MKDLKIKMKKDTPFEPLKDDEKKQLGENNEAKMTLYNALPRREYERVCMCKTIKEVWHTLMITHQDKDYSNKNHVQKFLHAFPLKWRANVTIIEEAKDLAKFPLDDLIGNLKVYEIVLENDGVTSKTTKEKVKSLALKAKTTREQTSDDSDSQERSDEDLDEDEPEAFNLMARNFRKFFRKENRFVHVNQFVSEANRFGKGCENCLGNKGGGRQKQGCYNCGEEGHFISDCPNLKENKAFIRGA